MANSVLRGVARDSAGNAISEPTVTVYEVGTETLATIFADAAGTAKVNPFTGDTDGEWEFYAAPGDAVTVLIEADGFDSWEKDLTVTGTGDHGALAGIADDDHAQYLLLAGRGGQTIADTITVNDIKAKAPWFDVRAYGAAGDGTTDDSTAIQAAIDAANAAGSGVVFFPVGVYAIESSLVLKQGAVLCGVYPGVATSASMKGSTIKARANLTTMIGTDLVTAREGMGLRHLLIDGNQANFTVTTGVKLFGRKMRLDSVDVVNVSGTGVHLVRTDFTPTPDQFCWVNWMTNCTVGGCAKGILNESTDSWFIGNYFGGNDENEEKCSGGNVWFGNHFDNSSVVGMKFTSDNRGGSGVLSPGTRIIGNYFDLNAVGLLFTSFDGSTQYEFNYVVSDNRFRANVVDVDIEDAIGSGVSGSTHNPGSTTTTGVRFTNCAQGLLEGIRFINRTYTSFFSGIPSDATVRGCVAGGSGVSILRSESQGAASLLAGNTSVTVTHGLFSTPISVQLTGLNASAVFFVNNVGATTFDIQVSASTGANRTVHWRAAMSP